MNSMISFGTKMRVMRALRNLKQAELAERTQMARRDITLFEKDIALPTPQTQQVIEAVFDIALDAPEVEQAFRVLAGFEAVTQPLEEEASQC